MYKGRITTPAAVTAGTNIPFPIVWNTSWAIIPDQATGVYKLTRAGDYDVYVNLIVTGVGNDTVTAQLYADGVAIPEAAATSAATATTEPITLTFRDIIRTVMSMYPNTVDLSIRLDSDATISNGLIIIEDPARRAVYA